MFSAHIKPNGDFSKSINSRVKAWASMPSTLYGKLRVPPELYWWYYNEFGTATKSTAQSGGVGRSEYKIEGNPLVFWGLDTGTLVKTSFVMHPGTKASRFVQLSLPEFEHSLKEDLNRYFRSILDNPESLKDLLYVGLDILYKLIGANMSLTLQFDVDYHPAGLDAGGKLGGVKAYKVWLDKAYITVGEE